MRLLSRAALSLLIPRIGLQRAEVQPAETFEGLEPVDPDPTVTVVDVRGA